MATKKKNPSEDPRPGEWYRLAVPTGETPEPWTRLPVGAQCKLLFSYPRRVERPGWERRRIHEAMWVIVREAHTFPGTPFAGYVGELANCPLGGRLLVGDLVPFGADHISDVATEEDGELFISTLEMGALASRHAEHCSRGRWPDD